MTWFQSFLLLPLFFISTSLGSSAHSAAPLAPLFDGLGDSHLEITTSSDLSQRYFNQGLIFHYGFNHFEAIRSFEEALRLDPACAMCSMGIALALGPNLNAGMPDEALPQAQLAIQKAQTLANAVTPRERMYIDSVASRYVSTENLDRSQMDEAYAEAMRKLAQSFPNDHHAQSLYAESLMVLHPWDFWTPDYKPQPWTPKILALLENTLAREPNQLFANHLYIHAVEASANAERALPSARRLAHLAPGVGHLVHMPAHIYIRIGMYHEGSKANLAAIEADRAYQEKAKAQGLYTLGYMPHNYHFLWATATLEGSQRLARDAAVGTANLVNKDLLDEPGFGTLQHFSIIPLYSMVDFALWDEILAEPAPEGERLYPMTVWNYARGMAEIAKNNLSQAQEHLSFVRKASVDERLKEVTIWELNTTQDLAKIAANLLEADLLWAKGNHDKAIGMYKQAVAVEDTLNYDEPSSWATPTRWYLGDALLKLERFTEAEEVFRENLKKFPKNGWALKGLSLALAGQGQVKAASKVDNDFNEAWQHADIELDSSRLGR